MSDLIRLEALELDAEVGVHPHEHGIKQRLIVDLAVECDIREAAKHDAIEKSVDYDRIAQLAKETVAERHHRLIETIAEKIAAKLLAELQTITKVFVRVAKPGAVANAKTAAVEIWRDRTQ